jgi:hypothetical protein
MERKIQNFKGVKICMEAHTLTAEEVNQEKAVKEKLRQEASMRSGISWFYWIAGLSMVNSIVSIAGGSMSFVVGLAVTQAVDAFAGVFIQKLSSNGTLIMHAIALFIDLTIAGLFVAAGYLGQKRITWAIILGMAIYALDGVLAVVFKDWMAAIFHLWALWSIWRGLRVVNLLKKLEPAPVSPYPGVVVSDFEKPIGGQPGVRSLGTIAMTVLMGVGVLMILALVVVAIYLIL